MSGKFEEERGRKKDRRKKERREKEKKTSPKYDSELELQ